jgi:hypothetical protein
MRFLVVTLFFILIVTACKPIRDNFKPVATIKPAATTSPTRSFTPTPVFALTASPAATETRMPVFSPTTTPPPTETATPAIITGSFNILSALELVHSDHNVIYSDDLGEQTHGLVTLENRRRNIGIQSGGGTPCDTLASQLEEPPFPCLSIRLIEPFVKNETNYVLLVTQIADSDCHSCSPAVYGAIFQETPVGWTMRLNSKIPVHGGGYGYSPWVELAQMGIEHFVLVFHHSDLSMGEYISADMLFIEDEAGWKEILLAETSHGRYGDEFNEEWGFRSEAEFVTGEHAPYYDYLIITSGTKYFATEDGGWDLRNFTEERRYIFRNGEYVLGE